MSKQFSIIIPAFNEEENVPTLLDDINSYFQEIEEVEVVIVDDGSYRELSEYIKVDAYDFELKIIRNKYNLGQSKSIEIGLEAINSNLVGLIDSDCQNPPSELRKAYDIYKNNDVDAVVSYRKNRQDDLLRKSISVFANSLLKIMTKSKFKDLGSSIKVIKKECLVSITFEGDMHRFISPMLKVRGFKILEIEVSHSKRKFGESKYGFNRIVPVLVDGILFFLTNGFTRPSKYGIGKLSLILLLVSFMLNIVVVLQKINSSVFVHRNPLFIIGMVFLLLSIQIFSQVIKLNKDYWGA